MQQNISLTIYLSRHTRNLLKVLALPLLGTMLASCRVELHLEWSSGGFSGSLFGQPPAARLQRGSDCARIEPYNGPLFITIDAPHLRIRAYPESAG